MKVVSHGNRYSKHICTNCGCEFVCKMDESLIKAHIQDDEQLVSKEVPFHSVLFYRCFECPECNYDCDKTDTVISIPSPHDCIGKLSVFTYITENYDIDCDEWFSKEVIKLNSIKDNKQGD